MYRFLSLLRGINVGGKKIFTMAELVSLYESLGFSQIKSYVQSGNILFCSPQKNKDRLKTLIERKISEKFGCSIPVIIKTADELSDVISKIPFDTKRVDASKIYITYLEQIPDKTLVEDILKLSSIEDNFVILNNVIYLHCSNSYGITKFNNNFFERKLKVKATSRNLRTSTKLLELINEIEC